MTRRRRILAGLVAAGLVLALGPGAPPTADAATPTQWRARLDQRDPPSYVVVRAPAAGKAFLHGQVSGLAAGATYAVTLRRGTCASRGSLLFSLPSVKARSDHQAAWTSPLTASRLVALRAATTGTARVAVRIGTARCGVLVRGSLAASPAHRIGVRTVGGVGELYDRSTGVRWTPRGNNYIHLASQTEVGGPSIVSHSTFNTNRYDPVAAEKALRAMQADGYTAVRVWISTCCGGGISDPASNGLSAGYLDNLVDFLERARAHRLQVMPTLDWLPAVPRYDELVGTTCGGSFGVANCHFMAAGGLAANERFFRDLIGALKARGARLDAVWAWQIRNELSFDSDQPPLTLSSGLVTAANGVTYDMAVPGDKKRIMDESLAWYVDRSRAAIRSVDPTGLVSVGFFVPQEPNPARQGDPRVIDPRPSYTSTVDVVDVHAYPGLDLTLAQLAENYGLAAVPPAKPLIFGEMGAFRFAYPTAAAGADGIAGWQVGSCPLGVDGWLTWTWDLAADPSLYTAVGDGGAIRAVLAPKARPDPCAWGSIPRDLARGGAATASGWLPGDPPADAFDHNGFTKWNSGGGPPQWISVELPGAATISQVLLHVSQVPSPAETTHRLSGRVGGSWWEMTSRTAVTSEDEWIVLTPPAPGAWSGISAVKVETTASPSWVAWWDIKVIGRLGP